MAETVGSPLWLVLIMGVWVVACLGIGGKAVFFDAEQAGQFED